MRAVSHLAVVLPANKKGLSLIEALLVLALTAVLLGSIFYILSSGELANRVSYTKVETQALARQIVDLITRDLRNARSYDLGAESNNPSANHLKFQPVVGWDSANKQYLVSDNYIEYIYSSEDKTLSRYILDNQNTILDERVFYDVSAAPFYTEDISGNLIPLSSAILQSRVLIILIKVAKQTKTGVDIESEVTTKVRIRNG